jgi:hypothetical protein
MRLQTSTLIEFGHAGRNIHHYRDGIGKRCRGDKSVGVRYGHYHKLTEFEFSDFSEAPEPARSAYKHFESSLTIRSGHFLVALQSTISGNPAPILQNTTGRVSYTREERRRSSRDPEILDR